MLKFRLPSPALVVSMLALALALGGTAVAASTGSDTKADTKLVKKLAPTLSVKHATTADALSTLPSGESESGIFAAAADNGTANGDYLGYGLTYSRPLARPIKDTHIIDNQGPPFTHPSCPGFGQAARGFLCLYDTAHHDVFPVVGYSNDADFLQQKPSLGVILYWQEDGTDAYAGGEWTVTAR